MNAPLAAFRSDHIALAVRDLAASRRFYEALGGRTVSKPSPHFLEIMLGEQRLHLLPEASRDVAADDSIRIDHFCVAVESVAALEAYAAYLRLLPELAGRPIAVTESEALGEGLGDHCEERPPLKTLYFADPDGIRIEVRAYRESTR